MTIEQLRRMYEQQPPQPFVMPLADGRQIPVVHREFIASPPSARTAIVYQPDDLFNSIDLLLATDLEVRAEAPTQ